MGDGKHLRHGCVNVLFFAAHSPAMLHTSKTGIELKLEDQLVDLSIERCNAVNQFNHNYFQNVGLMDTVS